MAEQLSVLEKLNANSDVCTLAISKKEWMELILQLNTHLTRNGQTYSNRREQRRYIPAQETIIGLELPWTERRRGEFYLAKCRDISSMGIGLFHNESIQEGTECNLQLLNKSNNLIHAYGSVRYCQPYDNGTYRLGIHLSQALNLLEFL